MESITEGAYNAGTATKDAFVSVTSSGVEYIGDGYQWCEDTACWAWDGTSTWATSTFGCGGEQAK